jgi:hypothetical protein
MLCSDINKIIAGYAASSLVIDLPKPPGMRGEIDWSALNRPFEPDPVETYMYTFTLEEIVELRAALKNQSFAIQVELNNI